MNNIHPSEKEIQQYSLDKSDLIPEVIAHIDSCPDCKAEVLTYQLIFSEIKVQPAANFDFELQDLVLSKLPKPQTRLVTDDIIAGFLVLFACFCVVIPVYVFRKIIMNMFSDIPPFFIYAIIISTSAILILNILFLYKKFLKQIHLLNLN